MSDQPNAPPPGEGEPAPATEPTPAPAPAPAPEGDPPEQTPEQQAEAKSRGDRRFAELTAKLSAAQRDRDRLAAEADFLRRHVQQQPQTPAQQQYAAERDTIRAEVEAKIRTETFHEQGASAYPDWRQRCDDLVKMGADPGFAQLLVEMPEGTKVAAALAEDPAAVERIANLRTERARAVALGKYAATVEDSPGRAPAAPRAVSNAPAPVRPVTGRANPAFNEYNATAQALVDKYMRDDLEARRRH
jgi:hypothetical protein